MLVLSSRIGEKVVINGGEIVIEVVCIDRGKVKLGFTAGDDVIIDREEIHLKKLRSASQDAAQGPPAAG